MKRIYHTWDKWECFPAGFYEARPKEDLSDAECAEIYRALLSDIPAFESALHRVITEWPHSCEQYLSNEGMNRISWLGQASLCIAKGIPACHRGGFNLLTADQQNAANESALKYLNIWMQSRGESLLTMEDAGIKAKVNLY
jgi:hypothetical protein